MISKELLEEEYSNKGKTFKEISDRYNISIHSIKYYAKKYKIVSRNTGRRRTNVIGKRFGKLEVLREGERKGNRPRYVCRCDCGNELLTEASNLTQGQKMCMPCRNKLISETNWNGYQEISGDLWNKIQNGAKARNISFDISIKQAWDIFIAQNKQCALSGVDLKFSRNRKGHTTASLDRIDSLKGYTIDNVQWVHKTVNILKNDLNETELIEWCHKIINHKGKHGD